MLFRLLDQEEQKKVEATTRERFFALQAASSLYAQLNELEKCSVPELHERVERLGAEISTEEEAVEDLEDNVQVIHGANEFTVAIVVCV